MSDSSHMRSHLRVAPAMGLRYAPANRTETDVRTETDERSGLVTAIYLDTAVDAGARIKDSTFISTEGTSRVAPIRATLSKEDA